MFDDLKAYFYENVWESYHNFVKAKKGIRAGKSRDLRLAIDAATAQYHLREHIPSRLRKSRAQLAKICPDYNLLGDVVNAAKHRVITRGNPQITRATNIFEQVTSTLYKDKQGDYWHGEKSVFVRLKDGSTRDLYEVLTNVLNMWLNEFHALGVLDKIEPLKLPDERIPPRSTESGASRLDLEIIRGLQFIHRVRLQKYNYQTGAIEPFDLTDAKATFRIYKPSYELSVTLKNEETGKEVTKTIRLSEEQSQRFTNLKNDEERKSFIENLADENQVLVSEALHELKEQMIPPPNPSTKAHT